jgi:hypothetical protein
MIADEQQIQLYWRVLTPMVILWGFIFQRLNEDHTCDAYLDYLKAGGADELDPDDPHPEPLSKRLCSESNSAYVQGRNRIPLRLIDRTREVVNLQIETWLGSHGRWKGHRVRLLDGTTFRLRPFGDLAETYGQNKNQHGTFYWVKARAVAAFDLFSQAVVGIVEGAWTTSETGMVWALLQQDNEEETIYLGDRNFGIYTVVQSLQAANKACLLRLTQERALALARRAKVGPLYSGASYLIGWKPTEHDQLPDYLSAPIIFGRLIYVQLTKPGFRPLDLYLFTTLIDDEQYPLAEVVELYGYRWQVEVDFRHVKTTLHMEFFNVHSTDLFRKELAAGLLAYNLVWAFMNNAARLAHLKPAQLSFSRCLRRVCSFMLYDWPSPVISADQLSTFLDRLAKCKLTIQPNKVRFEPRKVRQRPRPYPPLRGNRNDARLDELAKMAIS